ncbi:class I SAM-dependent methyltransferase [Dechloromonas denitrificans]|uniref:class I SAM-dependent methyltransferase n=1 Tax=Dechloromonas denitrificans TaxID=281362 RepID=UPI001CFB50E0|nr:class I SAM-dependent methyltransferase [Dechloromonas denitrificans]UCV06668.1 class I SAM-dependent methyltransferase [Dechloromonas denitrificans]
MTYRSKSVKEYWAARWEDIPADVPMDNAHVYPLKYAEMTVQDKNGRILEAGCGAGRILRYYHQHGYDIVGMDYIDVAISKLKAIDSTLQVETGDITALRYPDQSFKYVLAFGLYHNLEHDLDKAIGETCRVLERGGAVCASFRADNIQTRMTDWLAECKSKKAGKTAGPRAFHKMNLSKDEFARLFTRAGFLIEFIGPVENMPFLYKFAAFRASAHKRFDENKARSEGYRLSWLGRHLQNLLMRLMPDQFCNIYVLIARKT